MTPPPEFARVHAAYDAVREAAGLTLWHLTGHDRRPDPPHLEPRPPVEAALLDVGDGYRQAVDYLWAAVPSAPEEFVAAAAHDLLAAVTDAGRAPQVAAALDGLRAALDELAAAITARDAAHPRRRQATPPPPAQVTLAHIGRMAGRGRAAAAHWRRRGGFPPPVGGTAASPLFDRAAVAAWLTEHGLPIRWGAPEE